MTASPAAAHATTVRTSISPLFGRTYQAVCDDQETCGYRGPHVATQHRAEAIADEHQARMAGRVVTA